MVGLKSHSNLEKITVSESPIIYQPTNAINGFLVSNRDGEVSILFQARLEPGNVGAVQLAPTVQSTEANYKRLHGGKATPFVDCFLGNGSGRVMYNGLQSEEGSRYHGKYNRYIIVEGNGGGQDREMDGYYFLDPQQVREFVGLDSTPGGCCFSWTGIYWGEDRRPLKTVKVPSQGR